MDNPYARFETNKLRRAPPPKTLSPLPATNRRRSKNGVIVSSPEQSENQLVHYEGEATNNMERVSHDEELSPPSSDLNRQQRRHFAESRLQALEKSNQFLLDQMARLKSEHEDISRRYKGVMREKEEDRERIERLLRINTDLVNQLSLRLDRAEDRFEDDIKLALEKQWKRTSNGHILSARKENFSDIKSELTEMLRRQDRLERMTSQTFSNVNQVREELDAQIVDLHASLADLRSRSKSLEGGVRQSIESLKTFDASKEIRASLTNRLQSTDRLTELRDTQENVRERLHQESTERRLMEQRLELSVAELISTVTKQAQSALGTQRELTETRTELAELIKESTKRTTIIESGLRKQEGRSNQLDEKIDKEREDRLKFEQAQNKNVQNVLLTFKQYSDDAIEDVQRKYKEERRQTKEILRQISEAVNLLERQMNEEKRHHNKLLTAEITSRQQSQVKLEDKVGGVSSKLNAAISSLQQRIGGLADGQKSEIEKLRQQLVDMIESQRSVSIRTLADLDTRLTSLDRRQQNANELLGEKVGRTEYVSEEKLKLLILWQEVAERTLKDNNQQISQFEQERVASQEKYRQLKTEVNSRIDTEKGNMERSVEALKAELLELRSQSGEWPTKDDLVSCELASQKLSESLEKTKIDLDAKIQAEREQRLEEIRQLQDELDRLRATQVLNDTEQPKSTQPRMFIKPDNWSQQKKGALEAATSKLNLWSIYNVYRWLKIKAQWKSVRNGRNT